MSWNPFALLGSALRSLGLESTHAADMRGQVEAISRLLPVIEFDLQGNVLVRKNVATTPTGRHEDLMVIYPEAPGLRAIYFDNEGHVIHYRVTTAESQAVFTSEEGPGPRFRLTYRKNGDGTVRIVFEIAPPGGDFKTYLEGTVRKK